MINENQLDISMVQYLKEDGTMVEGISNKSLPSNELLIKMYKNMLKSRLLDEKLLKMQRQGRIGTYAPFSGQEAAQIGSAIALEKSDWLCPSYRDLAATMMHGMPIEQVLDYVKGSLNGGKTPQDLNILPIQIIIAAQTLHAVGLAYSIKLKKEKSVVICYLGDGATSEGDFHEALNFASIHQLPVIFIVQNNQYAISVPLNQQMASKTIAQKAIAYGMNGYLVDGNDVIAIHHITSECIEKARNNEGPFLIEAVTYRYGPHTTSDDPLKYREQSEVEEWFKKDPLLRMKNLLSTKKLWSEENDLSYRNQIKDKLNQDTDKHDQISHPTIDQTFEYVYEYKIPNLIEQQSKSLNNIQKR